MDSATNGICEHVYGVNKHNTMPEDIQYPDSKVHGANMGPIWGRKDPGGPHVSPMNLAIWVES